ncbi:hypothetical protein VM98_30430 [Streptomyces rubellomurinus subsp. indigoferus]|uniref:DUF397 domain-containing protein n=1 Tax=Streptomyces rubellomurinus (strain ATCC 31215) TaxID=359131 RepID=A0A0F2T6A9_STRR3|nr:hypothetical protein [Streptomyces rubellomurinus]KJS52578.1 hypothetical protein VM98_30430 [Streptomyces rubellomurinus subsp. indigoferus]KJS57931.1 hypothetical protein VM95_36520 [Streptomyces rubellomurinus]
MEKQELYDVTPSIDERFKSPLSQTNGSCATFAPIKDANGQLIGVYQGESQNPDILGVRYTIAEFVAMADGMDAIRTRLGL